jgi:hypothetical protein
MISRSDDEMQPPIDHRLSKGQLLTARSSGHFNTASRSSKALIFASASAFFFRSTSKTSGGPLDRQLWSGDRLC